LKIGARVPIGSAGSAKRERERERERETIIIRAASSADPGNLLIQLTDWRYRCEISN